MSIMRIQAALDYNLTWDDAFRIIDETRGDVEVFETGTPFLRDHGGLAAIERVRGAYPDITIYADTKVRNPEDMEHDGFWSGIEGSPYDIVARAFDAGADIATVMADSRDEVLEDVVRAAKDAGKEVLADFMHIDDVVGWAIKMDEMGFDYVSVNTLYVGQDPSTVPSYYKPLEDLKLVTPVVKNARTSIQGGVTLENIADIAKLRPSLICIGRGIYAAEDPRAAARAFKAILDAEEANG